jgi:hypothetical protein
MRPRRETRWKSPKTKFPMREADGGKGSFGGLEASLGSIPSRTPSHSPTPPGSAQRLPKAKPRQAPARRMARGTRRYLLGIASRIPRNRAIEVAPSHNRPTAECLVVQGGIRDTGTTYRQYIDIMTMLRRSAYTAPCALPSGSTIP